MYRKQQRNEQPSPCYIPQTQDGLNNVSDLISKFEVRNYPINRGLLPELSASSPRPGFIVPGTATYEASYRPYGGSPRTVYHCSPTHSPPLGQTGRRAYESHHNDTASLSDGADSVRPGRMDERRYRQRHPGGIYYQNGSLSSLNESDYYDETYDIGMPRTPPTGGRYYQPHPQQRYGDSALLEEVEEAPLNKEQVASSLTRFGAILQMLSRIPFPRMSVTGMGLCSLVAIFFCPRAIGSNILFPGFRLLFGTLYPAYASYKAVRTKNVKEYVKWMMYWIVFAFFTFIETFTDILLSWFPFYYEIKVIVVLWLLSPATRGSSTLYRKFVHPMLTRREQEIDDYINQAKEKGYTAVLQLGSKGVNYATNVIMQTAIKGGGGLVQTLRKSYSLSDLSEPDTQRTQDEVDEIVNRPQRVLRSKSSRSSSGSRQMEMYFPEVEIAGAPYHAAAAPPYNYIRSSDDISSGYSSAEPGLSRTASMSNTARPRLKSKTREDDYGADMFFDEQNLYYAGGPGGNPGGSNGSVDSLPQRATIYEVHTGSVSSLPAITQAGHAVELSSAFGAPIYSSATQSKERIGGGVPSEMNDKYKLFLAWMEEQQKRETMGMEHETTKEQEVESEHDIERPSKEQQDVASVKQEEQTRVTNGLNPTTSEETMTEMEPVQDDVSTLEDTFLDTISVSSNENDEFLEVENITETAIELNEPAATSSTNDHSEKQTNNAVEIEKLVEENLNTPEIVVKVDEVAVNGASCVQLADVEMQSQSVQETVEIPSVIEEKEPLNPTVCEGETSNNKDVIMLPESSNLLLTASSNSNLTSSSSSLAVSEGSTGSVINLATDGTSSVQAKKHTSFGKQRKAPPVPPTPEMIVVRAPAKVSPAATPSKLPPPIERRSVTAVSRTPTTTTATATPSLSPGSEKSKPKKFMSSLTGMFKGHGEASGTASRSNESAPHSAATGHPKETEI
ncbi:uncharacterized protein LOC126556499 [Anopheles maculipalpis]|uniref:uncharacterized protein LOC126556499 n=1 Tax=Anopheles maculipalpis TaxID=1496333 RepID=UPI00215966C1|nr:uncharacterized protein LOC126556499 [Anopheles maculipalpis]